MLVITVTYAGSAAPSGAGGEAAQPAPEGLAGPSRVPPASAYRDNVELVGTFASPPADVSIIANVIT